MMIERTSSPPQSDQLKKFNWGAMLLSLIWAIRHRVWKGLWVLVPFIGFFMAIVLGFKGNKWAWEKNKNASLEEFLKRQRRWSIAGVLIWGSMIGGGAYITNYSSWITIPLDIITHNDRVKEYLGTNIQKASWGGELDFVRNGKFSSFKVRGAKKEAWLDIELMKVGDQWKTVLLSLSNSDEERAIIDLTLESSLTIEKQDHLLEVPTLQSILEQFNLSDFLRLVRSKELNDFMEARLEKSADGTHCFSLTFSEGFTPDNKELYRAPSCYKGAKEVASFMADYASGKDDFKKNTAWQQVKSYQENAEGLIKVSFED